MPNKFLVFDTWRINNTDSEIPDFPQVPSFYLRKEVSYVFHKRYVLKSKWLISDLFIFGAILFLACYSLCRKCEYFNIQQSSPPKNTI